MSFDGRVNHDQNPISQLPLNDGGRPERGRGRWIYYEGKFHSLCTAFKSVIERIYQFAVSIISKFFNLPPSPSAAPSREKPHALEIPRRIPERPRHIPSINHIPSEVLTREIKQIAVLSQYESEVQEDMNHCGYHAIKNALLTIHYSQHTKDLNFLFNDKAFYQVFYTYARNKIGLAEGQDLSLPHVITILNGLKNVNLAATPLRAYAAYLNGCCNHVSSYSYHGNRLAITSEDNLDSLVNLQKVATKPGPFVHSFIVGAGDDGHWITLTVEKKRDNTLHFYGMDSLENDEGIIRQACVKIKTAIRNHSNVIRAAYYQMLGTDIEMKSRFFNLQHKLIAPGKRYLLFSTHRAASGVSSRTLYLNRILKSYQLMAKEGWLSKYNERGFDPVAKTYVCHLKKLALGFSGLFRSARLPVPAKLRRICNALNGIRT